MARITPVPAPGGGSAASVPSPEIGDEGKVLTVSDPATDGYELGTAGAGDLLAANNLDDLDNAGTARTNLGLGTAAVAATGDFEAAGAVATHSADTTSVHGIADTSALVTTSDLTTHAADTTSVHGIADTSALALSADVVAKALFNAHTILAATTDDTPAALTVSEDALVGRLAGGNIASLSVAQVRTLLGLTDELIQDLVGAMVTGGTETGISVTYDDTNGRFDFVVSGGGLPTGGAQGTALVKNSATDGDASFVTPPWGGGDYYRSGYYSLGMFLSQNLTTLTCNLNIVFYQPFFVSVRRAFDRIAINVNTGGSAGATLRLGMYTDAGGKPGSLVFDGGTVASTSSGAKTITIAQTLNPGLYWTACVAQTATSIVYGFPTTILTPWVGDTSPLGASSGNTLGMYETGVSGALPSTATPLLNTNNATPAVQLRAA